MATSPKQAPAKSPVAKLARALTPRSPMLCSAEGCKSKARPRKTSYGGVLCFKHQCQLETVAREICKDWQVEQYGGFGKDEEEKGGTGKK